jgi:hypothetical protein
VIQFSTEPGLVVTASIYVQALPAFGYLIHRIPVRGILYVVLGGLIAVLANLVSMPIAQIYGTNLFIGYIAIPFIAGANVLALAEYQQTLLERLTFRISLGLFIVIYLLLVIYLEDITHFGQYSQTLYSLFLLVAALWTLGRRSLMQEGGLAIETDWFWIALGLAIYGAATAATGAIGNILLARERIDLFVQAWNVRGALVILAFISISWGVFRGPARGMTEVRA